MSHLRVIAKDSQTSSVSSPAASLRLIEGVASAHLESGERGVISAVDAILTEAASHHASDVHFEPLEDALYIRFRVDGMRHDVARISKDHHPRIIARLKILAKLVVYQRDVPQDGRIEPKETSGAQAMRVSTFPTVYGEKAVVRVLGLQDQLLRLDALGFAPLVVAQLRELLARPQGTVLLTGPSSSGKTTTIYALLQELIEGRKNATHTVTIEDPVEYRLGRIAQTEIRPDTGFTFANALRAILRQDPEVIMVGEIRDPETAHTAIQAGLTGHLVISTIHSGTAAGVFTRLLDMGVETFLLASSVSGVLAQRLVRRNCPHCLETYAPDPALLARFGLDDQFRFQRGAGCEACQGIGYRGRTAIGELLLTNETLCDLVLQRSRTRTLHEVAVKCGMATLLNDGLEKVRQGITTMEELQRVLPPGDKT
ncbi:MAG: type II/IV secretion system protein [Candidatus Hydrogenedentes bacterium]|nr:type II/IV secretion system protein [Candidatus Hydrogenedentota bacterium]